MLKMKIVVISDSFKGSLSSGEIVDIFNNVRDEYYIRFSKRVRRLKVMEECIRKKNRSTRYRKIDID